MNKKADWQELLKDKRLLGALLAGGGGALVGGGLLPGLIWKRPTWGQRGIMGGTSGAIMALLTAAAMQDEGGEGNPVQNAIKSVVETGRNVPAKLLGYKPKATQLREMSDTAKALYGTEGTGIPGWISRQVHRAMPNIKDFGGSAGDVARAAGNVGVLGGTGLYVGTKLQNMAKNWHRAADLKKAIINLQSSGKFDAIKDQALKDQLEAVLKRKGGFADTFKALGARAATTIPGSTKLLSKYPKLMGWITKQRLSNPFLMTAGVTNAGNAGSGLLAQITKKSPDVLGADITTLAKMAPREFTMPKAYGILGRAGRLGRRSLPIFAALLASRGFNELTGANTDYNQMVSQDLFKGLE